MAQITFDHQCYETNEDESVLDCLIRHEVDYPCACKAGVCQSCLAQLTSGKLDPNWQKGLKQTLIAKNYFLACLAKSADDISLALPNIDETTSPAVVKEIQYFNSNVACLRLLVSRAEQWIPGQYVNLINSDGCRRSYSIANIPKEDGYIELHIKLVPNGKMSDWINNVAYPGCKVYLQGPIGDCFYVNPAKENFAMVLAGTGTGLAPLLGIVRDALQQGHQGKITLIHGGVYAEDLYLDKALMELTEKHQQLTYKSCVLKDDGVHQAADINDILKQAIQQNPQARVYICGPQVITKKLKTTAFLAGISSAHIYSDSFVY